MIALLALHACTEAPGGAGGDPDGLRLAGAALHLGYAGRQRLVLPLDELALGEVRALEDWRSYDPTATADLADGGVTWRRVTGVSGALPDLALALDGGGTADLHVARAGDGRWTLSLVPHPASPAAYLRVSLAIGADEGLYGLGSALDHVDRRGSVRATQLELDPTTEALDNEAHVHLPFVLGTAGWGFLARDDHPAAFDLGAAAPDRVSYTVGLGADLGAGLSFDLYAADQPLDVTARLWAATGGVRPPARWALGPWHWRDEDDGQEEVESDLRTLRDLDLPTTGLWIDRPYATGVNTFDFDPARYPDPDAMVALAHDLGFRVALWHTPYTDPEGATELYDEATARGFFPPEHPPSFVDWGTPVDLSSPDALAWWQGLVGRYAAQGIEGYKLDYAEEVLVGAPGRLPWTFADGTTELTKHADYQRLYHRAYAETLPAAGGFLLCRSGAWGDWTNGTIVWPGDLDATMARWAEPATDRSGEPYVSVGGLPASLVDALSLGPSGFAFYGSDTGGYRHSPPDEETFLRWVEQTALSTVMQVGNSSNDVVWEPTPENGFGPDTIEVYRSYTRLHLRLWPYLWTLSDQIARGEGRPPMRPLGLAFPELGRSPDDAYLLGPSLLVAPVVERGAREREVPFPEGRWIGWFDGAVHEAGTETVAADLGDLPLFLAEGGIVPMLRPTIDTLEPVADPDAVDSYATTPGVLWVRVWPGPASSFELFDGARVEQGPDGEAEVVRFSDGDELREGAMLELVGATATSVTLDGEPLPERADADAVERDGGFATTADVGGTVLVRIPAGGGEVRVE